MYIYIYGKLTQIFWRHLCFDPSVCACLRACRSGAWKMRRSDHPVTQSRQSRTTQQTTPQQKSKNISSLLMFSFQPDLATYIAQLEFYQHGATDLVGMNPT